ncbi:MAG: TcpQ domain-containing protein, partial [Alphaproteobacteria bacterium]|nr:TcpQ domain-containing protein [Alphaproteobacteria bacterium]
EWCGRVHVEFNWMAEYDYPLEASFGFNGTFEEAVRDLLTGFEAAHPQPVAELHTNPAIGQMVMIVQTRGNTDSD